MENGLNLLSQAVSVTLGPKGRNVVLGKQFGTPQIINDGITIAREINPALPIENTGVSLIRQAASKTNDIAGDGTTTATVIAHAIIRQGLKNIAAGSNPIIIKRGFEQTTSHTINIIVECSRPIKGWFDLFQVATISSGNKFIGRLIRNAFKRVGLTGPTSIEESRTSKNELEIIEGLGFKEGFLSGYFVTDKKKMKCILHNAYILITDRKLTKSKDVLPTLELIASVPKKTLLVMGDTVQNEALSTLILNNTARKLKVAAIRAPRFGKRRKDLLFDLAVLTGGQVICSEIGLTLKKMELTLLGRARSILIKRESTTIIPFSTNKQEILVRCTQLRRELAKVDSIIEKKNIQERLKKLSGGIAIIKVGGATETEMKDQKLRIEDAVNATKAAINEGIVPGGGATLAHLGEDLRKWVMFTLVGDELVGGLILITSMNAPIKRITINAGKNGAVIFSKVTAISNAACGYDASIKTIVNMYEFGIIDPIKVTRSTLQNATSIGGMVLTTNCLVVDKEK